MVLCHYILWDTSKYIKLMLSKSKFLKSLNEVKLMYKKTAHNSCNLVSLNMFIHTPIDYQHNSQNNQHVHYLQKFVFLEFFCLFCFVIAFVRTQYEIRSNKFFSTQYCVVNYRYYIVQQISRTCSSYRINNILTSQLPVVIL